MLLLYVAFVFVLLVIGFYVIVVTRRKYRNCFVDSMRSIRYGGQNCIVGPVPSLDPNLRSSFGRESEKARIFLFPARALERLARNLGQIIVQIARN